MLPVSTFEWFCGPVLGDHCGIRFALNFKSRRPISVGRWSSSHTAAIERLSTKRTTPRFTPHDLRRTGATIAQAARLPVDFVKALLNHNDKGVTGIYARWHMFEEKREAVLAIEAVVISSSAL